MSSQQTLTRQVSYAGTGLHSGNRVEMTLLPAAPGTGIRFRRGDLEGKPELEARVELVVDTQRSTTLGRGAIKVHTVEHVLAALAGAGVSNAIVELNSNEPPIADGSAREFARIIREAGISPQAEALEPYRITHPLEVTCGDSQMAVFPADTLKISCTSSDKQGRYTQFLSIEINPANWEKEIAHARTFCFFEEIEYLIKNGLIKGGSLENAVVIREDAVLTNEPLRYPDEFVRHKILDIIGDLSLIGRPILGHIIAIRPGHQANAELARAITAQMRRPIEAAQTFAPPPTPSPRAESPGRAASQPPAAHGKAATGDATMDVKQVMQILPHRPPFLMVDRVTHIEGNKITGTKCVTMNEGFFEGHFPGHPVMPGVLQLEAIAQVAGILTMRHAETAGKLAYFMSAENVKWRKPVVPGDQLIIDVEVTKSRGKISKAHGICRVDGEIVSEADVTFMIVER